MKNKKFILMIKRINGRKSETLSRFFIGTPDKAREEAQAIHDELIDAGYRYVRVEIWEIIATDYKGTIRK